VEVTGGLRHDVDRRVTRDDLARALDTRVTEDALERALENRVTRDELRGVLQTLRADSIARGSLVAPPPRPDL
jgi:hypothetical protein